MKVYHEIYILNLWILFQRNELLAAAPHHSVPAVQSTHSSEWPGIWSAQRRAEAAQTSLGTPSGAGTSPPGHRPEDLLSECPLGRGRGRGGEGEGGRRGGGGGEGREGGRREGEGEGEGRKGEERGRRKGGREEGSLFTVVAIIAIAGVHLQPARLHPYLPLQHSHQVTTGLIS